MSHTGLFFLLVHPTLTSTTEYPQVTLVLCSGVGKMTHSSHIVPVIVAAMVNTVTSTVWLSWPTGTKKWRGCLFTCTERERVMKKYGFMLRHFTLLSKCLLAFSNFSNVNALFHELMNQHTLFKSFLMMILNNMVKKFQQFYIFENSNFGACYGTLTCEVVAWF